MRRAPRRWPELIICLSLLALYTPAVTLAYGLKDDYTFLASAHGYAYGGLAEPASSTRLGRPLFGLVTSALYTALPDVESLWIARALAIVGMALFAVILYRALGRLLQTTAAALIAVFICSMPPFQVYVGWATLFCAPYSAALGALAALAAARSSDATRRERLRWLIAGEILLLLSLAMYQPTAMSFWLIALILALSRRHSAESLARLIRCVVAIGVPAMIGAYLMLKIGVWTLGAASPQRSGLLGDIPAKLRWVPEPIGLALNLFNMPQATVFAVAVALAVSAGVVLFCRDCTGRTRTTILLIVALTVPLSFAPSLLSQESYATFRTVGPLTATFALLAALLFVSIEHGPRAWQRLAGRGGVLALTAVGFVLGFDHLRTLIALPLSREWHTALSQVARVRGHPGVIGFLAPTFDEGSATTRYGVRDEFGVPTSASTWTDASFTWLAARQTGTANSAKLKVLVTVGRPTRLVSGISYIDMRNRKRPR